MAIFRWIHLIWRTNIPQSIHLAVPDQSYRMRAVTIWDVFHMYTVWSASIINSVSTTISLKDDDILWQPAEQMWELLKSKRTVWNIISSWVRPWKPKTKRCNFVWTLQKDKPRCFQRIFLDRAFLVQTSGIFGQNQTHHQILLPSVTTICQL